MRKRNVAILFRLNKKEAEVLDKKVKKSGLNREAYLRQLISGVVPRDAPPPDYYSMMRELHKIGNNLNQIAQKAHVLNVIDVQRYDQEVWKFNEAVRKTLSFVWSYGDSGWSPGSNEPSVLHSVMWGQCKNCPYFFAVLRHGNRDLYFYQETLPTR